MPGSNKIAQVSLGNLVKVSLAKDTLKTNTNQW